MSDPTRPPLEPSAPEPPPFDEAAWRDSAAGGPTFRFRDGAPASPPDVSSDAWRDVAPPPPPPPPPPPRRPRTAPRDHDAWYAGRPEDASGLRSERDGEQRQWAMISHAAGAAGVVITGGTLGWIVPLVVWLIHKDSDDFASIQAKEALNFQITLYLAGLGLGLLTVLTLGLAAILAVPAVAVFFLMNVICSIQGAVRTFRGEAYEYPFNFRLIP